MLEIVWACAVIGTERGRERGVSPERSLGAGPGAAWRPVFACLCRCEVAVLRCRCRQVAGKARLRWVLWARALADYYYYYYYYYYYCYYSRPREASPSVRATQSPRARWPAAEAGTGACGVQGGAAWGAGWGWGRGGSWRWGRWEEMGAPDLLRHSVSSAKRTNNEALI